MAGRVIGSRDVVLGDSNAASDRQLDQTENMREIGIRQFMV
jgi:hypothetical protein